MLFRGEEFHGFSQTRLQQRRERSSARLPNTESGKRLWFVTTSGSQCEMNKISVKCRACGWLSHEDRSRIPHLFALPSVTLGFVPRPVTSLLQNGSYKSRRHHYLRSHDPQPSLPRRPFSHMEENSFRLPRLNFLKVLFGQNWVMWPKYKDNQSSGLIIMKFL